MRAITIDADTGKRVYTRKEVADLVGASTQSIRLWEDAGAIPASVRDEGVTALLFFLPLILRAI